MHSTQMITDSQGLGRKENAEQSHLNSDLIISTYVCTYEKAFRPKGKPSISPGLLITTDRGQAGDLGAMFPPFSF